MTLRGCGIFCVLKFWSTICSLNPNGTPIINQHNSLIQSTVSSSNYHPSRICWPTGSILRISQSSLRFTFTCWPSAWSSIALNSLSKRDDEGCVSLFLLQLFYALLNCSVRVYLGLPILKVVPPTNYSILSDRFSSVNSSAIENASYSLLNKMAARYTVYPESVVLIKSTFTLLS